MDQAGFYNGHDLTRLFTILDNTKYDQYRAARKSRVRASRNFGRRVAHELNKTTLHVVSNNPFEPSNQ